MPDRDPRAALSPGRPVAPIALEGGAAAASARLATAPVDVPDAVVDRLRAACHSLTTEPVERAEASRDWWPLAMTWALDGRVAALASAVARPTSAAEVAAVLAICDEAGIPVTAAAGRSGVCGASVPLFGGLVLDLCGLSGIVDLDDDSLVLDVRPGTFGTPLENELRTGYGVTLGHWPQSIDLSTVGGWLACRSAGQASTRYGKIEDMVVGLDVALADGRLITTGGAARAAVGPDLTQVFVGSEGTLGVICGARLRVHPIPEGTTRSAWAIASFGDGLDSCRRVLRRHATPAVLRLYDPVEADRNYHTGERATLLVLDEGEPAIVEATATIVAEECRAGGAEPLDGALVDQWLAHRNDVSMLEPLIRGGLVVDTMEIVGRWRDLPRIYADTVAALGDVDGTLVASGHLSHSYLEGACLYFTFAGKVEADDREAYYTAAWDAGTRAVLAGGGALSHHHGIGLNRARFMREALGPAFDVLAALKRALDPNGILNPGKLGLPSPFGAVPWP
ncbi:MAG: FAD-binding oxidoreductase [Acidimicrobiales bacterium]